MLTKIERAEKEARILAIKKEKEEILAKTKLHRENPTKEGNEELKTFITRSQELSTEINTLDSQLISDDVERGAGTIIIKQNKGDGKLMNIENMTREQLMESAVYRDAFYKDLFKDALLKRGINRKLSEDEQTIIRAVTDMNANSVGSGAEYLLPMTTVNKIQSIMVDRGVIWNLLPKTNFKGNVTMPIGTRTSTTKNADGVAQLIYAFTELEIKQTAIVAEIKVQNLLLENAIEDLENYLAQESAKYLLEQLDFKVLNGDTTFFDSILTATTPIEYGATVGDAPTYTDIMACEGSIKQAYAKGAKWLMNRKTYFTKFKTMTDVNGNLLVSTVPFTNGNAVSEMHLLDGIMVEFTDDFADGEFMLFNPMYYFVNVSKSISINVNTSIYENVDKTAWYAKVYAGGKILFADEVIKYYVPKTV